MIQLSRMALKNVLGCGDGGEPHTGGSLSTFHSSGDQTCQSSAKYRGLLHLLGIHHQKFLG